MDEDIVCKGVIGKGAFGSVYLVENAKKEEFAVKVMVCLPRTDKAHVAQNELKVLKMLSHDHVLAYVDFLQQEDYMYIITEYCAGGDLSGFLDLCKRPLPEDLLVLWLWHMACGLEYMHLLDRPVLHRDLKPSNVYLTDTGVLRLGDMGIARVLDTPTAMAETFCGTPPYMSPEALGSMPHNPKTDIWSLGCCVVEMATLKRAYEGSSIYILRDVITKKRDPLPAPYSQRLDELLSQMLVQDYQHRMSATEVLNSEVLQDCFDRGEQPLDVLKDHELAQFLANNATAKRLSPPQDASPGNPQSRALTASLTELRPFLQDEDPDTPLSAYRHKVESRLHGRTEAEKTMVNQDNIKTVINGCGAEGTSKRKTTKVSPTVRRVSVVPEAEVALSRDVLSSFSSHLSAVLGQSPGQPRQDATKDVPREDDLSSSQELQNLRGTLTRLLSEDSMSLASSLVSTASTRELQEGLASLLKQSGLSTESIELVTQIIIFTILKKSAGSQS